MEKCNLFIPPKHLDVRGYDCSCYGFAVTMDFPQNTSGKGFQEPFQFRLLMANRQGSAEVRLHSSVMITKSPYVVADDLFKYKVAIPPVKRQKIISSSRLFVVDDSLRVYGDRHDDHLCFTVRLGEYFWYTSISLS